jgi:tRNA pseudouridine13 synthase
MRGMEITGSRLSPEEFLNQALPCITAGLSGIRGRIKTSADDFRVEEIPAYPPEGQGDHLFLLVEKRDLSAEQLVSHLARCLKIAHQDIGTAGMKDRQAVTRQVVSVPAGCLSLVEGFSHEQIRILETHRHPHKLRTGHLKGNRFSLLVRDAGPDALEKAQAISQELARTGVPNYFGEQRFGREAETLKLGIELLNGTKRPGSIPRARRKFLLRLALSAAQSALFNLALARRIEAQTVGRVQAGDVMQVVASGGPFVAVDPAIEQPRCDAREIVISGPMFGPKMKPAAGDVATWESELLAPLGIAVTDFERYSNLTPGTRRPYLIWPEGLSIAPEAEGIRLEFTLPPGSYATVVLREFQKSG